MTRRLYGHQNCLVCHPELKTVGTGKDFIRASDRRRTQDSIAELARDVVQAHGPFTESEVAALDEDAPKQHRWSGWPGAWCLDCGDEDRGEKCVAEHDVAITCVQGHPQCEEDHEMQRCTTPEHVNRACPSPGKALADPYGRTEPWPS